MAKLQSQELFYPDFIVTIGQYTFSQGIAISAYSNKKVPYDWARIAFTKEFHENISLSIRDKVSINIGYNGELSEVFSGLVVRPYNKASDENEIMIKDKMLLLESVNLTNTFLNVTPQEIIEFGLKLAGVTEYVLSKKTYPSKRMVPVVKKNMVDVLIQINNLWGIDILGNFIQGIFYWGEQPEQGRIYQFEYGNNVISLERKNNLWELETVALPFVQHSMQINVAHPAVNGFFEVEGMEFSTNENGFIRTKLYF